MNKNERFLLPVGDSSALPFRSREDLVRLMRTGLLSEMTEILSSIEGAIEDHPLAFDMMRAFTDCKNYCLIRLGQLKPSPATLSGLVRKNGPVMRRPLQVMRVVAKNTGDWIDDDRLCGLDLRRIRDRLQDRDTPSCIKSWPKGWIPGYGPKEGCRAVLRRGCLLRLAAITEACGDAADLWRRLAIAPVWDLDGEERVSALRIGIGEETPVLMVYIGEEGREVWRPADSLHTVLLTEIVNAVSEMAETQYGYTFIRP